jgi:flavin reductase (DIM6/NTAB) family NADH-FMN oxidoreductase RutF
MNTSNDTQLNPIIELFRKLTLGVYVIGVTDGSTRDAFTAASVTQVSYRPLMLSLAVNPEHVAYALLSAGRTWTVNVLSDSQSGLARRFGVKSPPGTDKMSGMSWGSGRLGAPFLVSAMAYFDCRTVSEFTAGDHQIVVGNVIHGKVLATHAKPLSYSHTGNMDQSAALYPTEFDPA